MNSSGSRYGTPLRGASSQRSLSPKELAAMHPDMSLPYVCANHIPSHYRKAFGHLFEGDNARVIFFITTVAKISRGFRLPHPKVILVTHDSLLVCLPSGDLCRAIPIRNLAKVLETHDYWLGFFVEGEHDLLLSGFSKESTQKLRHVVCTIYEYEKRLFGREHNASSYDLAPLTWRRLPESSNIKDLCNLKRPSTWRISVPPLLKRVDVVRLTHSRMREVEAGSQMSVSALSSDRGGHRSASQQGTPMLFAPGGAGTEATTPNQASPVRQGTSPLEAGGVSPPHKSSMRSMNSKDTTSPARQARFSTGGWETDTHGTDSHPNTPLQRDVPASATDTSEPTVPPFTAPESDQGSPMHTAMSSLMGDGRLRGSSAGAGAAPREDAETVTTPKAPREYVSIQTPLDTTHASERRAVSFTDRAPRVLPLGAASGGVGAGSTGTLGESLDGADARGVWGGAEAAPTPVEYATVAGATNNSSNNNNAYHERLKDMQHHLRSYSPTRFAAADTTAAGRGVGAGDFPPAHDPKGHATPSPRRAHAAGGSGGGVYAKHDKVFLAKAAGSTWLPGTVVSVNGSYYSVKMTDTGVTLTTVVELLRPDEGVAKGLVVRTAKPVYAANGAEITEGTDGTVLAVPGEDPGTCAVVEVNGYRVSVAPDEIDTAPGPRTPNTPVLQHHIPHGVSVSTASTAVGSTTAPPPPPTLTSPPVPTPNTPTLVAPPSPSPAVGVASTPSLKLSPANTSLMPLATHVGAPLEAAAAAAPLGGAGVHALRSTGDKERDTPPTSHAPHPTATTSVLPAESDLASGVWSEHLSQPAAVSIVSISAPSPAVRPHANSPMSRPPSMPGAEGSDGVGIAAHASQPHAFSQHQRKTPTYTPSPNDSTRAALRPNDTVAAPLSVASAAGLLSSPAPVASPPPPASLPASPSGNAAGTTGAAYASAARAVLMQRSEGEAAAAAPPVADTPAPPQPIPLLPVPASSFPQQQGLPTSAPTSPGSRRGGSPVAPYAVGDRLEVDVGGGAGWTVCEVILHDNGVYLFQTDGFEHISIDLAEGRHLVREIRSTADEVAVPTAGAAATTAGTLDGRDGASPVRPHRTGPSTTQAQIPPATGGVSHGTITFDTLPAGMTAAAAPPAPPSQPARHDRSDGSGRRGIVGGGDAAPAAAPALADDMPTTFAELGLGRGVGGGAKVHADANASATRAHMSASATHATQNHDTTRAPTAGSPQASPAEAGHAGVGDGGVSHGRAEGPSPFFGLRPNGSPPRLTPPPPPLPRGAVAEQQPQPHRDHMAHQGQQELAPPPPPRPGPPPGVGAVGAVPGDAAAHHPDVHVAAAAVAAAAALDSTEGSHRRVESVSPGVAPRATWQGGGDAALPPRARSSTPGGYTLPETDVATTTGGRHASVSRGGGGGGGGPLSAHSPAITHPAGALAVNLPSLTPEEVHVYLTTVLFMDAAAVRDGFRGVSGGLLLRLSEEELAARLYGNAEAAAMLHAHLGRHRDGGDPTTPGGVGGNAAGGGGEDLGGDCHTVKWVLATRRLLAEDINRSYQLAKSTKQLVASARKAAHKLALRGSGEGAAVAEKISSAERAAIIAADTLQNVVCNRLLAKEKWDLGITGHPSTQPTSIPNGLLTSAEQGLIDKLAAGVGDTGAPGSPTGAAASTSAVEQRAQAQLHAISQQRPPIAGVCGDSRTGSPLRNMGRRGRDDGDGSHAHVVYLSPPPGTELMISARRSPRRSRSISRRSPTRSTRSRSRSRSTTPRHPGPLYRPSVHAVPQYQPHPMPLSAFGRTNSPRSLNISGTSQCGSQRRSRTVTPPHYLTEHYH